LLVLVKRPNKIASCAPGFSHIDLTEEQRAELNQLLHENRDVFAFTDDELGHTSLVQHHIGDTGNAQPIRQQPYRISPTVRNCIDEHVGSHYRLQIQFYRSLTKEGNILTQQPFPCLLPTNYPNKQGRK
jgi:hypothetical protein